MNNYCVIMAAFLLVFLASSDTNFTTARLQTDRLLRGSSKSNIAAERRPAAIADVRIMAADTLQVAGSRLPDCSHACGSCRPCRLVMVGSDNASSIAQAESYPVSYRCMCNNKTYPIP